MKFAILSEITAKQIQTSQLDSVESDLIFSPLSSDEFISGDDDTDDDSNDVTIQPIFYANDSFDSAEKVIVKRDTAPRFKRTLIFR